MNNQSELKVSRSALDVQVGGAHYKNKRIQPVEYIDANHMTFLEGCVVKRITRHRDKNGADDIRKIIHECRLILELVYGETEDEGVAGVGAR